MLEILAPAGNEGCAKAAIHAGADAIYLGYNAFSARQGAENFTLETLRETVINAHLLNVKVYVAMNTLIKDEELSQFFSVLESVWNVGIDAVILQDVFLGKAIKKACPQIVMHLSTQAGICNVNGAKFAKQCGFSRVILARETPIEEIKKITKIIETEAFVQGALCTAFSGQCYFSSFVGGNSGNRGRCKQPCRKLYTYNRDGFNEKLYALSLADLSVGDDVQKLIEAGVTSFKIEGRMRRAEYVSAAVSYYRAILDNNGDKNKTLIDLKRTYNRGNYTKGLAFGQDKRFLSAAVQGHIGEKIGVVKVINGQYFVESAYLPRQGDAFKIIRDGKEVGGATFFKVERRGFVIQSKTRLKNGDGVFITTSMEVAERLLNKKRLATLSIELYFHENEKALIVCGDVRVQSEDVLQSAKTSPLTKEELTACFLKTDGLFVDVLFTTVSLSGNVFITKGQLNALRRTFYDKIRQNAIKTACISCGELSQTIPTLNEGENNKTAVIGNNFTHLSIDVAIWKPNDYRESLPESFVNGAFEKYIYYPPFCTADEEQAISLWLQANTIDGIYAENYGAFMFAKEHNVKIFVGTGLNVFNVYSAEAFLNDENVSYYAISKETTLTQQKALRSKKAFAFLLGDVKVMDLCYCPFGKTCKTCDKKTVYELTDENGRVFPVRRYLSANGSCRFEVYNCVTKIGKREENIGALLNFTLQNAQAEILTSLKDIQKQKEIFTRYTIGHDTKGIL